MPNYEDFKKYEEWSKQKKDQPAPSKAPKPKFPLSKLFGKAKPPKSG
jgi:hypothetical protein